MNKFLLIYSVIFIQYACKTNQNLEATIVETQISEPEPDHTIYYLSESACFGKCPVFNLEVHETGLIKLEGKQNCKLQGSYQMNISPEVIYELELLFHAADFDNLPNKYSSMIADVQTISISKFENGLKKTVTFRENRPESLMWIKTWMHELAMNAEGWQAIRPEKEMNPHLDPNNQSGGNLNELLIELKEGVRVADWFKAHKENLSLELKRKLTVNGNVWLFAFDDSKFSSDEILSILKKDSDIKHAELNQKVELRDK